MRLFVTGGAGFIGANFVRWLLANHADARVTNYDALTYAGNLDNLGDLVDDPRHHFVHGDLNDGDLLLEVMPDHDAVINFAAESHNSRAVLDPRRFVRTNVLGTQSLLDAARRTEVRRVHHVSTCEVYGDLSLDSDSLFTETSPYLPRTPYSSSKAAADHLVRAYGETFGLAVTITNCANNYGPYQFPEKVVPLFATRALDDRPLPLYASTQNRREWIHVTDHCRAVWLVLTEGELGETYHVGTGVERTIEELADAILDILDKPAGLKKTVPDRPGHDRRYVLDWSKIRTELGWEPRRSFEDGLAETITWYAHNRDWWEPLQAGGAVDEEAWSGDPTDEGRGR